MTLTNKIYVRQRFQELSRITRKVELAHCVICHAPFIKLSNEIPGKPPRSVQVRPRRSKTCSKSCTRLNTSNRMKKWKLV